MRLSRSVMCYNTGSGDLNILSTPDTSPSTCSDLDVVGKLCRLHEHFVIVPVDKASNSYNFVFKKYYTTILIEDLGIRSLPGNLTYKSEIVFYIWQKCWTTINLFLLRLKYRQIVISSFIWFRRCMNIPICTNLLRVHSGVLLSSILLTKLLTHVTQCLQKYYETAYSRNGNNQFWIIKLKNIRTFWISNFNLY